MRLIPRLKLTPKLIRLAYRLVDVEASAESAVPDERMLEYAYIGEKLATAPAGRALDVGCTARLNSIPAFLTGLGWEVWGIDTREYKFRHPGFHMVVGDIRNTEFPDSFFDVVCAVSTIEHIGFAGRYGVDREDTEGDSHAINEIARVLRPGGTLLCTIPYSSRPRVIKPMQRVYDPPGLDRLFQEWRVKSERWCHRNSEGYWQVLTREATGRVENTDGSSAVALLELTPNK